MSPFAAVLLVVPLVWPARFVGADASCFTSADPPLAPAPVVLETPVDESVAVEPAPVPVAAVGSPLAVSAWGEISLVIVPATVDDAG